MSLYRSIVSWLAVAALSVLCGAAHAVHPGDAIHIADVAHGFPASPVIRYLEDPGRKLRIDDVATPKMAERFRRADQGDNDLNFGYSNSAYWLALPIDLAGDCPARWLLEAAFPSLDRVEVYTQRADGSFHEQVSGDLQPFSARPYPHRNLVFPITLVPGKLQTVYVRVVSAGTLTIPLTLWQAEALHQRDQTTYALLATYYGVLVALLLYNLLLYFALRDAVFVAYVAFVIAMLIAQASWNGFGNQFLWPDSPEWGNIALPAGMAMVGLASCVFTRLFFDTRRLAPQIDHLFTGLTWVFAVAVISPMLLDYHFAAIFTSLCGLAFSVVTVPASIYFFRLGRPGSRYFLVAWMPPLLGAAVLALRNLGMLPTTGLTTYALQIGSAIEALLLSIALAERVHAMRRAALNSEQATVDALRKSEQDLESRVRERTRELEQANEALRQKESQLEYSARHDPLTRLPNRALLDDRLHQALVRARRSGQHVAVLLADLDEFKQVNDAHGHPVGDRVLRTVANRLTDCVRSADTIARLGGDEFVIVVENLQDHADATRIADKLIAAAQVPVDLPQGRMQVGLSIGIAYFPQHAHTSKDLVKLADDAMYLAKQAGGNRWRESDAVAPPRGADAPGAPQGA